MRAQSALPEVNAKAPTEAAVLAMSAGLELVPQTVLEAITVPELLNTLRLGSARAPPTPNCVRLGPSARMRSVSVPLPLITNPGISMFAPVPTSARVEILMRRADPFEPDGGGGGYISGGGGSFGARGGGGWGGGGGGGRG